MDRDLAQQALHKGDLTEALITPAEDANGWVILLVTKDGEQVTFSGHTGTEKVYHDLDRATDMARELGFDKVRVEEFF